MTSTQRPESAPGSTNPGDRKPAAPAFRIRYGRLALAVLGLLSLLTGVVSAALRLFGVGSGWLPAATLLGAVAAVVLLRRLAVRDRRRKVNAAFRSAMGAPARRSSEETPAQSDVVRELRARQGESALRCRSRRRSSPGRPRTLDSRRTAAGGTGRGRRLGRYVRAPRRQTRPLQKAPAGNPWRSPSRPMWRRPRRNAPPRSLWTCRKPRKPSASPRSSRPPSGSRRRLLPSRR